MYKFYNANALGRFTSDCVIRSVSCATQRSWDEVYDELSDLAQSQGILLDDVEFVEGYLDKRYKRQCHYSKTVGEFIDEFPVGIYLITMEGHITTVIDGTLFDTFDCRDSRMWCSWKVSD